MFDFEFINKPVLKIDLKIVYKIFKILSIKIEQKQNWILNLVFVETDFIKNLNKQYRNIDKSTDVLSFHYYDDFDNLKKDDVSWEIIFCEEKIISQWKEYWLWEEKEFYKLLIHSLLHILWFDHEKDKDYIIMQDLENKIWEEVFEK